MKLSNKKLLVLGAGRGHLGLMETAKKMGIYTIVATQEGDYPCIKLADKVRNVDIAKPHDVLEIAIEEGIDGVIICCSDTGLPSVGFVNERLNLSGISENASILCKNKYLMKNAFIENNVRTAKHFKIRDIKELEDSISKLLFPLVIKSVDLQGSKGIYVVKNIEEALDGFKQVIQTTKENFCIIEEYIEGWEFGAQAFVYNGQILFMMPHGDITYMSNTPVPVGHYIPLEINDSLKEDLFVQITNSIYALGLNNCAVNIDFICKDNEVYVIELTGRGGANCLTELVSYNYGIDYYEMIICTALGADPSIIFNNSSQTSNTVYAEMLMSKKDGQVKKITQPNLKNPDILEFRLFVEEGSNLRVFQNSNDVIGQIIVKGDSTKDCKDRITKTLNELNFELL